MTGQDDFWSRRKTAVRAEAEAAQSARSPAAAPDTPTDVPDEVLLEQLGLPDPDTLGPDADFSAFLQEAVPERLRRRALRRLWLSNPVLANLDELVDYGEDFTDAAMVPAALQTAYQVGKGMMHHVEEIARQAEAAEATGQTVQEPRDELPPSEPAQDSQAETADLAPDEDVAQPVAYSPPAEDEPAPAPRRKLRFEFAGQE